MTTYLVWLKIQALGDLAAFEQKSLALLDALLDMEATDPLMSDSDISGDTSSGIGVVNVHTYIEAPDKLAAAVHALTALRTAIHAAGGATPGWEAVDWMARVTPADAADMLLA